MFLFKVVVTLGIAVIAFIMHGAAWAALPLITDDAGTQGKGGSQVEFVVEYDKDKVIDSGVTTTETDYAIAAALTYGIMDVMDVFVAAPYVWDALIDDQGNSSRTNGFGDTLIGVKWRFFEKDRIGLAFKPFMLLPSGNDSKTLGNGKVGGGLWFITAADLQPLGIIMNAAYWRNENTLGDRQDIWHLSAAAVYAVSSHWKVCAEAGTRSNTDRTSEREPRYLLGGFIYAPVESLELSFGIKQGFNDEETDWAVFPGITYRF